MANHNRRNSSPGRLRKGPVIVKILCGICIAQVVFTIYVAVKVLNATLQPDQYIFSGAPSVLSDRQRDLALAVGDLDRVDVEVPMEFSPDDETAKQEEDGGQQPGVLRKFLLKPLSIFSKKKEDEQQMNQLIVSGNVKQEDDVKSKILMRGKKALDQTHGSYALQPSQTPSSTLFPKLKKFAIRPLEDKVPSNDIIEEPHTAHHNTKARLSRVLPKLSTNQTTSHFKNKIVNTPKQENDMAIPMNGLSDEKSIPSVNSDRDLTQLGLNQKVKRLQHSQLEDTNLHQQALHSKLNQRESLDNRSHPILHSRHGSSHLRHAHNMPVHAAPEEADQSLPSVHEEVLVYGKAAIGRYLWSHLLAGDLMADEAYPGTLVGNRTMESVRLVYREGPGLIPGYSTPPRGTVRLVLVTNGRTEDKVQAARRWLDHLANRTPQPRVLLVLLGSERCENDWLKPYVASGLVKAVLLTYDDPIIDNTVYYQWPLGVATYRQFPVLSASQVRVRGRRRPLVCSLRATLHSDSPSRHQLAQLLRPYQKQNVCSVAFRDRWEPNENRTTMTQYVQSLLDSDLALCPTGYNAETYRLYEALEAGAVPVLEDRQPDSGGRCDTEPLRLLKETEAPVMWLSSWFDLQEVLDTEKRLLQRGKEDRRLRVQRWYTWFKRSMAARLVTLVKEKLLV